MSRKHYTQEQKNQLVAKADQLIASGKSQIGACKELGFSNRSYAVWKWPETNGRKPVTAAAKPASVAITEDSPPRKKRRARKHRAKAKQLPIRQLNLPAVEPDDTTTIMVTVMQGKPKAVAETLGKMFGGGSR